MQHNFAARRVMMQDQRLGVVEQNLPRYAAKGTEGTLQSVKPAILPLMSIRAHMQSPRVAEGRDKEEDLDRSTANLDPAFTKVDLQLFTRLGLKPQRRTRCSNQFPSQRRRCAFDRPQADDQTFLGRQLLANHIGIAAMAVKPLGDPVR